ncbi:MAG TPA: ABC transporter ATP-binding protein [Syntrophorhabdaceae bacterium]|nr:ABC transporter ATP-binding protein [Syntrophorhabdaceae bacterium]HQM81396.1 ABC transporter ATP-binding protein [Syntrophorhabdaceae bacterium]
MIRIENLETRLSGFNLHSINLSIEAGEFFILMGPTGAGKTVLLEAIAGLVPVRSGRILIGGKDVTRLPPEKRGIGIVYQDYVLFPHMTVMENIRYGLHFHRLGAEETEKRLKGLIGELELMHLVDRIPLNLSGGELQRVALARALMVKPAVLLLDEPLSALDPNFREDIRHGLERIHRSTNTTFLMVTHDFAEALSLGSRGAVMNNGRIEQAGRMEDIFQRPGTPFVADFVGMKNIFEAQFSGSRAVIGGMLEIDMGRQAQGDHGLIAIRPDDITIAREKILSNNKHLFKGTVAAIIDQGFYYEAHVQVGKITFKALVSKRSLFELRLFDGAEVFLSFEANSIHAL